ncbi:uncharacterized protein FA14DRAFT_192786 [Meira miltonrushii]|uniref:Peptidase S54 rhomboid domain-containing protein n=1 Tax=Meira miltonrushii TaxID=1280837 RepID=A0A316V384_9BASI|nr:uncharacterized protein FA14DRAFT_192786 [Meira miltonrushii]PWN31714.1 hypothetical protein FA14DRAFT_192786 [Meira miltonrushii]
MSCQGVLRTTPRAGRSLILAAKVPSTRAKSASDHLYFSTYARSYYETFSKFWQSTNTQSKIAPEHEEFARRWKKMELDEKEKEQKEEEDYAIPESEASPPKVIKPILYFFAVGTLSYSWAAYMTANETGRMVEKISNEFRLYTDTFIHNAKYITDHSAKFSPLTLFQGWISEAHLRATEVQDRFDRGKNYFNLISDWCSRLNLPQELQTSLINSCETGLTWYGKMTPAQSASICGLVVMVVASLGLKLSKRRTFAFLPHDFGKYFMHIPAGNRLHTLTTSLFCPNFIPLGCYSFVVLYTVSTYSLDNVKRKKDADGYQIHIPEVTIIYHFLAFILTSATFSNVASQIFARVLFHRAKWSLSRNIALMKTGAFASNAGAMGAFYGLLAASFVSNAEIKLPYELTLGKLILGAACVEVALLTYSLHQMKFQVFVFNNAAHAGGLIFGYIYSKIGDSFWERLKGFFYERNQRLVRLKLCRHEELVRVQNKLLQKSIQLEELKKGNQ